MHDINPEKVIDKDLEKLMGECNALEARMAAIMLEILTELDNNKNHNKRLDYEAKEEIKSINNKIFEQNEVGIKV